MRTRTLATIKATTTATMLLAMAVLGGAAGCYSPPANSDEPVKIALMAPRTGVLEFVGESFVRVAEVAVDSINDLGGIDGRVLELTVSDTQADPNMVGAKLQALADDGIIAVVGPATSDEVLNASPVAAATQVPIISPSATAPSLSDPLLPDDGYMFRNVPSDFIQGIAMAVFLYQQRAVPVSRVALLYEDTSYGRGLVGAFTEAFTNLGGTIADEVTFVQNFATGTPAAAIAELADISPAPVITVMVALEGDAVKLAEAWDNGGAPLIPGMEFFMTDGARSSGFLMNAPRSLAGQCGTAPTFPVTGLAYQALKDAYEARYDDVIEAQVFAPNVWDAFHLVAVALTQQAHDGQELGGPLLRNALTSVSRNGQIFRADRWRDLIIAIRNGNDVDYDGAAGPNDLSDLGEAVGPYEVWCISADSTAFEQLRFLDARDIVAPPPPT